MTREKMQKLLEEQGPVRRLSDAEFEAKSSEWIAGWVSYQMTLDEKMTREEMDAQSDEWWRGFLYANASNPFFKSGYVPMNEEK